MSVMHAYFLILALTWLLVGMNVRWSLAQFRRDRSMMRLSSYIFTVVIMGALISFVARNVVSRVLDAEESLGKSAEAINHPTSDLP